MHSTYGTLILALLLLLLYLMVHATKYRWCWRDIPVYLWTRVRVCAYNPLQRSIEGRKPVNSNLSVSSSRLGSMRTCFFSFASSLSFHVHVHFQVFTHIYLFSVRLLRSLYHTWNLCVWRKPKHTDMQYLLSTNTPIYNGTSKINVQDISRREEQFSEKKSFGKLLSWRRRDVRVNWVINVVKSVGKVRGKSVTSTTLNFTSKNYS